MAYKRKTIDTWEIQVNYGYGWDHATTELSLKDARATAKLYREETLADTKIMKKRERIENQAGE
jgi:predicted PP-loop superfamily ATPase